MPRLPYDLVAIEADKILVKMVCAPSWRAHEFFERYLLFITACGWTDLEFDMETLRRVDAAWDLMARLRERKIILN
jgi:hypothetical protein